jgi:omega-hydroxy-beta-dihydromenaquinone-9 sulfotransferase
LTADSPCNPVFVIGMPRSGTTILFEALARHPDLGWISNYCRVYPTAPWVNVLRAILDNRFIHLYGHKKQYGSAAKYNLWLPQPDEAYEFWDLHSAVRFSRDALRGLDATPAAREALRTKTSGVVAWQNRERFGAKLTGPPRIHYLRSVFPDAIFIHVVRDGRAVAHSLLNVRFWRCKGGLERPFWSGLLEPEDVGRWEREGRDAAVLAAVQWKRVIEVAREECATLRPPARYIEIRYEDFTAAPHAVLTDVLHRCKLSDADDVHRHIDNGPDLRNMNSKFHDALPKGSLSAITSCVQPLLTELGYT